MTGDRAVMDGPYTHSFGGRRRNEEPVPFYSFTVLEATDADGNRHIFHVPTAAIEAYDAARSTPQPEGLPQTVDASWLWAYCDAVAQLLIHERLDCYEHTGDVAIDDLERLEKVHRLVLDGFDPLPFDSEAWLAATPVEGDPDFDATAPGYAATPTVEAPSSETAR
ncbi:MAG: hypothetical protein JO214_07600 [Frankiaceae bacterium]|nr:hypothetical protein [Frankiaceae bacterium]